MENKDKLVVEFWQIENVVNMRVLNQPSVIERGCGTVCKLPWIHIMSGESPKIDRESRILYIRGREPDYDKRITCCSFESSEQASSFIDCAVHAITVINYMVENDTRFCVSNCGGGAVNCIAGLNASEWEEFKNGTV